MQTDSNTSADGQRLPSPQSGSDHPPSLVALLVAFGSIGLTSFGGARAAYFRHTLVLRRRWIDDEQFLEGLTVSQVLPGPNVSNLSVYLGQRLRGFVGAAVATGAVLLPGTVLIVALAAAYFGHGNVSGIPAAFKGVGAAAVGLSLATTMQVGVKGMPRRRDWLIGLVTFLTVSFLHVSLLVPLATIAPLSIWLSRPRLTRPAASAGGDSIS